MAIKYKPPRPAPATPRSGRTPFLRLDVPPKRLAFLRYFGLFLAIVAVFAGSRFQQKALYHGSPLETADGIVLRVEPQRLGGIRLELALVDPHGETVTAATTVHGPLWKATQPGAPIRATYRRANDGKHLQVQACTPR